MKKTLLALSVPLLAALLVAANPASAQDEASGNVLAEDCPVNVLEIRPSFESLTEKERHYAHWMAMASWAGAEICLRQTSEESSDIFAMLLGVASKNRVWSRQAVTQAGVTDREYELFRQYAASVFSNLGNYSNFGDSKFVPRLDPSRFALIVRTIAMSGNSTDPKILELLDRTLSKIYSLDPEERALGLGEEGVSTYFSEDMTKAEIDAVQAYLLENKIEGWNTRCAKIADGSIRILFASIDESESVVDYRGRRFILTHGDHADVLAEVNRCLEKAHAFAANDNQRKMIRHYIRHFQSGAIDAHKDAMRAWVKDLGPVVETNLGFIETYRDPTGIRAEWEGLVAVVNKEQTKKFAALVDGAPQFLPRLPWGKDFEKDAFKRPDFTSLEVLCFANGGIPAGINIPNYDEIRQREGFKNVSLGNVLAARKPGKEKIGLIEDADQDLYRRLSDPSFEVQVGLHELLGHGSGKLLEEADGGKLNFAKDLLNPVTEKPVATWYKPGETWGSKFGGLASTFEECRAEAVGLYLSTDPEVLKIFGHEGAEASDVTYVNWLNMARAGFNALQFFEPKTKKWGQAHMHARFALMNVMLRDGDGVLALNEKNGEWTFKLDRGKIATNGKKAVGDFLRKLNVYKATADAENGRKLYDDYTSVDANWLKIRDYALAKRKPRNLWVQPVTDIDAAGRVILREYPATTDGVIESTLDRFAYVVAR